MKLAVTLDVEADCQWDHGCPVNTRNVRSWPRFQELCDEYGVIPTYLLTSEMAADGLARDYLSNWQRQGLVEVGAHLHPWTTPPFVDAPGLRFNDRIHAFPSQLPTSLLQEKLHNLTREIASAFGAVPTAFRAGRFGFDLRVAQALVQEGYVVDSSVTPLTSWRDTPGLPGEAGPDFSHCSVQPFRVSGSGGVPLIEIPVTVLPTYDVLHRYPTLLRAYQAKPARAIRKVLLRTWLQPQPMWLAPRPHYGPADLLRVWRHAERTGVKIAVMMFHSSELLPGGSPFRPTAESIRALYRCLTEFFREVRAGGGSFIGLTAAARELSAGELEVRGL
jgi:hypothetical protein